MIGGAIKAGQAYVEFLLEDKQLKGKLAAISKQLTSFGKSGLAATAPLTAAFAACAAAAVEVGDAIGDMSVRTGISAEALSELRYAASQSGTSLETIERGVRVMQKGLAGAGQGVGTFAGTLGQLGVSLAELRGLSPDQQFQRIAEAISRVQDPALKAALAQKAFGKAGAELLPLMSDGAAGLAALRQKAQELGVTMSTENVAAAQALDDALATTKEQFLALAVQIGSAIAGPLAEFLTWTQETVAATINLVRNHQGLVVAFAETAAIITTVSTGLVSLGVAAGLYTSATKGAAVASALFGTVMGVITAHPIIAGLTAIAGLALAIAKYFGWAGDGAAKFSDELSQVKKAAGVDVAGSDAAKVQAASIQRQLQASLTVAARPVATAESAVAMSRQAEAAIIEGSRAEQRTAVSNERILRLLQQSRGLIAGAG